MQSTKDAIISLDRHGHVVFWNRGAEEIFGYAAEDMLNQPVTRVIPERFRKAHQQGILRAAAAGHLTCQERCSNWWGYDSMERNFLWSLHWRPGKLLVGPFFYRDHLRYHRAKRSEDTINALVRGTASVTGEEFFPVLVRQLAAALEVSNAFVTSLVPESQTKLRILASWEKTAWGETFEYESRPTPCGVVLRDGMALYDKDVQNSFPEDPRLRNLNMSSYLGIAMSEAPERSSAMLALWMPLP